MLQNKRILLIALLFILFSSGAFAQGLKRKVADKKYSELAFFKAVEYYEDLASKKNPKDYDVRRTAECYRMIGNYKKSEYWYGKLVNMSEGVVAEDHYYYAQMLKSNEKYVEANVEMAKFFEVRSGNSIAKEHIQAGEGYVEKLKAKSGMYVITNLGKNINSDEGDFSPAIYNSPEGLKFVFTSTRRNMSMLNKKSQWAGDHFSDFYKANMQEDWSITGEVKTFSSEMKTKYHEGPASFSNNGEMMYVTKTNYIDGKVVLSESRQPKLQIFISKREGDKWEELVPFKYNNKEYSVAHASVSEDGKVMYFSSDAPEFGGVPSVGGKDIWKSVRQDDGEWGVPENVAKVNTEADEAFPYITETGVLYFASEGHLGLGGFDVYKGQPTNNGFLVTNMGYPLNTSADDFAFIIDKSGKKGFVSSNREAEGALGGDDIYSVVIKPISSSDTCGFLITITDAEKGNLLDSVKMVVVDKKTGKEFMFFTDEVGVGEYYLGGLDCQKDSSNYTIKMTKKNYYTKIIDIAELKSEDGIVRVNDIMQRDTGIVNKYCKIDEILFDFEKWDIRPDAAAELDKLVSCMKNNPEMIIEIGSHTDCVGPKRFNRRLSDKRAKASRAYVISRGIEENRIYGKGYGEERILNRCECEMPNWRSDCSEEEHQVNRRTEFRIVTNDTNIDNNSNDSFED